MNNERRNNVLFELIWNIQLGYPKWMKGKLGKCKGAYKDEEE